MNFIRYVKGIAKEELMQYNIVVDEEFVVGDNVVLYANVCLLGKGEVGDGCIVGSNSVIENSVVGKFTQIKSSYITNSTVGEGCVVGPFSHIRDGCKLGKNCRVGNYVEIKNSIVGDGLKMAHLTYVGDAEIGRDCNIGCGVVFCNYNGEIKQKTVVGDGVFIGSNCNLVAPLKIGDGAYLACGGTITQDVKNDEFVVARSKQINKNDFCNPYKNYLKKR